MSGGTDCHHKHLSTTVDFCYYNNGMNINTPEEDAIITAAALSDPDARPLTDAEWADAKPKARAGRPASPARKVSTTIRFDPEVLAYFQAAGPGWQTRMNTALKEWMQAHPR